MPSPITGTRTAYWLGVGCGEQSEAAENERNDADALSSEPLRQWDGSDGGKDREEVVHAVDRRPSLMASSNSKIVSPMLTAINCQQTAVQINQINAVAVQAMVEEGIDIAAEQPKILTTGAVKASDVVITMGCGDTCPYHPGKRYEDWVLDRMS